MNWEQRLREMILAGGAVAAAACSGGVEVGSNDASSDATGGGSSSVNFGDATGCCNANGDPCCVYLYCTPDATPSSDCIKERECESDGGVWDYNFSNTCKLPDAAPQDASQDGPQDAPGIIDVTLSCCNANPDPCCETLHCGAPMTLTCSRELACQADGGTWNFVDGGCALAGDAGADGD
jgi:hypothetical protein